MRWMRLYIRLITYLKKIMILLCLPMTDLCVSDLFHGKKTVRISSSFDLSVVKLVSIVELITLVAHCMDLKNSKMSFVDRNILDLFSRVSYVSLSSIFFCFIGSMIFFFFEKMLYHLMVLVAPVILCFSSKSYYTFFWKPGWHRLLVISRGFLFIFNFLIYFFLSYSINIFISHHVCLSNVWHSSSLHDENLHFHICRPVLPS